MSSVLGQLVIELTASTGAFQKSMRDAHAATLTTSEGIVSSLKNVETQLSRLKFGSTAEWTKSGAIISASLAGIGVAAAGATLVVAKQVADEVREMAKLSQSYGISLTQVSQLRAASALTGVSLETMAMGLGRLARATATATEGGKMQQAAFRALGVEYKNADGSLRPMSELLPAVAERFSKMADGTGKTALAMQLLGRSGAQLLPFLNLGKAGIEAMNKIADDFGLTLGIKDAKAALELKNNMELLDLKAMGFKETLGIAVMPALNAVASAFLQTGVSGQSFAATLGGSVGTSIINTVKVIDVLITSIGELEEALLDWSGKAQATVDEMEQNLHDRMFAMTPGAMQVQMVTVNPAAIKAMSEYRDSLKQIKAQHDAGTLSAVAWANAQGAAATKYAATMKKALETPLGGVGSDIPKFSSITGTNKAAAEQMRQMESLLKSMKADWGLTLAEEASFWDQMLVPAKKYADNLRKVTDQINDILGRMREETRKLTEKLFGTPEDQAAYKGTGIQPPMATYGEAGKMFDESQHKAQQEELNTLEQNGARFVADLKKREEERKSIIDAFLTPMEQLAVYQERLNLDYHNGTISGGTWARAMADATDNIRGMYDPTIKLEKEIQNLNQLMADPKTALSIANYTHQLAALQAQEAMARLSTAPMSGMAGVKQGIGAGVQSVGAEWQGMPAETAQATMETLHKMQGAFSTFFSQLAMGTKTVGQAFAQLGRDMLGSIVDSLAQMLAKWVTHEIAVTLMHAVGNQMRVASDATAAAQTQVIDSTTAQKKIGKEAAQAAAGAYNAMADIPYVGPILGAIAAAATFTAVMAFGSFAEKGGVMDRDGPVFAHAREMILPANISQHVMATAGGGGAMLPQKLTSYLMDRASSGQQPAPGASRTSGGHTFNFAINGATDSKAVGDEVMVRVQRFFRTGGVRR